MQRKSNFADTFEVVPSRSGAPSLLHSASGVWLHSMYDPELEARSIADAILTDNATQALLIGGGLGYVFEALNSRGMRAKVLEPYPELLDLAAEVRPASGYAAAGESSVQPVYSARDVVAAFASCDDNARVWIAPYVRSLSMQLAPELRDLITRVAVAGDAQRAHSHQLRRNLQLNAERLGRLATFKATLHRDDRTAVIVGSGPSLGSCLDTLRERQRELLIVACSSAARPLRRAGISANWIVALESAGAVCTDLDESDSSANILVFPWTHPELLARSDLNLFVADEQDQFATSGGTTLLTAADLAWRISAQDMYLVGADLSYQFGSAVAGTDRPDVRSERLAPKFVFMREAIETWLERVQERKVWHVHDQPALWLKGAVGVSSAKFSECLLTGRCDTAHV